MKKLFKAFCLISVFILVLTGCNSGEAPASGTSSASAAPSASTSDDTAIGSKAEFVMKFALNSNADPEHPQNTSAYYFEKIMEERTGGRVDVEVYPYGQLGDARSITEGLQLGTIEMIDMENAVMVSFVPEASIYDLPYLFRDLDHAHAVLDGPVGQTIAERYQDAGMRHLGYSDGGFRYWTNNKRPVNVPEDMQGLKMRVMESEIMVETMNGFGAAAVPMAFAELYTALQQGTVDGQDNPLDVIFAQSFFEVQKYLIMSAHFYYPRQYLVSESFYQSLPEDLQLILEECARNTCKFEREELVKYNATIVDTLVENGMEVCEINQEAFIQVAQEKIWPTFYEKLGDGNADAGRARIDEILAVKS